MAEPQESKQKHANLEGQDFDGHSTLVPTFL